MDRNIDVLILCGGEGKRLKKISGSIPKPMVDVGGKVFLDIIIDYLHKAGFRRIILGIGYRAQFIKKYYSQRKVAGMAITFSEEKKPLGTGGAVKKAKRFIKSKFFFVLNGDTFSKFNVTRIVKFYKDKNAKLLVLLRKAKARKDYGVITLGKNSEITSFNEKIISGAGSLVNGGVYLFSKSIFSQMPQKDKFSLECDFFPQMIGKSFYGYSDGDFFIDIGTPKRFLEATKYFLKDH